ncbi:MAG: serine/threonine protein phosphatase, partial [Longimicrobiales bacterium]
LRLMQAWLVLTGLSTLTTYQHHFIDIPAGILAGLIAIGLFPDDIRVRRASRLAAAYAFGALILSAAAFRMQGLGWVLLWPAAALSVVSLAYWTERPALFGKSDRGMRPLALVVLAPYVAGAWLNSRFWTRGRPCAGEIEPGVWIGRAPRRGERDRLGIRSVVDVGAELPVNRSGIDYRAVPMLDLVAPSGSQLRAAAYAISGFETARPTLVCCALGYSRSAAAGAAWLVVSGRADTADAAAGRIRTCRPDTLLTQDHCRSLAQFASAPR